MATASDFVTAENVEPLDMVAWLKEGTEIYSLLVSIHSDEACTERFDTFHASQPNNIDGFVRTLRESLDDAIARLSEKPFANFDHLSRACLKVGMELHLKLKRLDRSSFIGSGPNYGVQVHNKWSMEDVNILKSRLEWLISQSPEEVSSKFKAEKPDGIKLNDTYHDPNKKTSAGDRSPQPLTKGFKTEQNDESTLSYPQPANSEYVKKISSVTASLLYEFILESLTFKSMHDREEQVIRAHDKSFEWVFTDTSNSLGGNRNSLSRWLGTDSLGPIYWITGRPGSGKSTFMRSLFHHELTCKNLQEWAVGSSVLTAGFFFWTSGSKEQRSRTGLIRSLLYQLLSENLNLIPSTFPLLWDKLCRISTKERVSLTLDWSVLELTTALHLFLDAALPTIKVCLFIDGLDEFDGNHHSIISFFREMSKGKRGESIKMCFASRPWAVFEDEFGQSVPHLRLQDLTYDDMYRYTRDRLCQSAIALDKDDFLEDDLVKEIVHRADGVFLWVKLATNEMISRFTPSHSLADLFKMLQKLPSDLDELFSKLLLENQSIEELSETAIIFLLICAQELVADFVGNDSANSLTVWDLAFALHEEENETAISFDIEVASENLIREKCDNTVQTVMARFAHLLDFHSPGRQGNSLVSHSHHKTHSAQDMRRFPTKRVTYIHRTVRDWLIDGEGVRACLISHLPAGFDAHLRLLRSYVLRLKRPLEEIEIHRRLDEWWPDIALALTHARYITHDIKNLQRLFLNELNATMSELWLRKPQDPYDHWARNAFGSYEIRMKAAPIWQPFLCLAARFGLTKYIAQELETRRTVWKQADNKLEIGCKEATPLLTYATEFLCSRKKTIFPLSDPALVGLLLENETGDLNPGANHYYIDFGTHVSTTPWLSLLQNLRDAQRRDLIQRSDLKRWTTIVKMFIEIGNADPAGVLVANTWDPEISAVGVLEQLDGAYDASEIRNLQKLLTEKLELYRKRNRNISFKR